MISTGEGTVRNDVNSFYIFLGATECGRRRRDNGSRGADKREGGEETESVVYKSLLEV